MLSYGIGLSRPLSIDVQAEGNILSLPELGGLIRTKFHFTPQAMIHQLDLLHRSYEEIAKKGHFGHSDYPWEQVFPFSSSTF
jgi:S-adenosylmethionine synthetase